MSDKYFHM